MAKQASEAKRTNRVLGVLVVLLLIGAGAVALFVEPSTASDATVVSGNDATTLGVRPAEVSRSNFSLPVGVSSNTTFK